tara:strand:- start:161 stop:685 length:525 start_codon:yes stop_codon:yes gene_type:complete
MNKIIKIFLSLLILLIATSCSKDVFKKVDTRETPIRGIDRAKKNIEEGRGRGVGNILGIGEKGTNYEFSTSNPLWRATLDVLDFLPLSTVDYSGGIIITDWYSDNTDEGQALKITVRFLSNIIQTNSVKVVVHRKKCSINQSCKVDLLKSRIQEELVVSILREAALLEKQQKNN